MPFSRPIDQIVGLAQPDGGRGADVKDIDFFQVEINPTTRVIITGAFTPIDGASSPYSGTWAAPQSGAITSYVIETINPVTDVAIGRVTLTGTFPDLEELFRDILYPANGIRNAVSWANVIPDSLPPLIFSNATQWEFANLDGTRTAVFGTGFTYDNGRPVGGFAERIVQASADGSTIFWDNRFQSTDLALQFPPIGVYAASNDLVFAGLFDADIRQMYFDRLLGGLSGIAREGQPDLDDTPFDGLFDPVNRTGTNDADILRGGIGDDILSGLGADDHLFGGLGADQMDGGTGDDDMTGGRGDDRYVLSASGDTVTELRGEGRDTVLSASISITLGQFANVETARLTGNADLNLTGSRKADALIGNGGDNLILGSKGRDILTGNGGDDGFVFAARSKGRDRDTITDFTPGDDKIVIDRDAFAGLGAGRRLANDAYIEGAGQTVAEDRQDRFIYDTRSGALYFDKDGTGRANAVQIATLQGSPDDFGPRDFLIF